MYPVRTCCVLVAILSALPVRFAASSDRSASAEGMVAGPPAQDFVDVTANPAKHSHIWFIMLGPELEEIALKDLRLTVVHGPGCGPPVSIWKQLAASAVTAGAAGLHPRIGPAISATVGAVTAALMISPRHSTFGGKKVKHFGDGWYALTFKCQHEEGTVDPAARLFVRLESNGRLILSTPWRPLVPDDSMTASVDE